MDLQTLETDAQAVLTSLKTASPLIQQAIPLLEMVLPAPEKAVLVEAIAIINAIETAAPNIGASAQAFLTDVKAVVAAVEAAKTAA